MTRQGHDDCKGLKEDFWSDSPWNLFITERGRLGSGLVVTQIGDMVWAAWVDGTTTTYKGRMTMRDSQATERHVEDIVLSRRVLRR
jgi:hypothetical protein